MNYNLLKLEEKIKCDNTLSDFLEELKKGNSNSYYFFQKEKDKNSLWSFLVVNEDKVTNSPAMDFVSYQIKVAPFIIFFPNTEGGHLAILMNVLNQHIQNYADKIKELEQLANKLKTSANKTAEKLSYVENDIELLKNINEGLINVQKKLSNKELEGFSLKEYGDNELFIQKEHKA